MKLFNTAGTVNQQDHYALPSLSWLEKIDEIEFHIAKIKRNKI